MAGGAGARELACLVLAGTGENANSDRDAAGPQSEAGQEPTEYDARPRRGRSPATSLPTAARRQTGGRASAAHERRDAAPLTVQTPVQPSEISAPLRWLAAPSLYALGEPRHQLSAAPDGASTVRTFESCRAHALKRRPRLRPTTPAHPPNGASSHGRCLASSRPAASTAVYRPSRLRSRLGRTGCHVLDLPRALP